MAARNSPASGEENRPFPSALLNSGICEEFSICAPASGERFHIHVWMPGERPSSGYRCLYILDCDDHFAMFAEQAVTRIAEGWEAPVLVGIGYSKGARTVERRIYDLTPRAARYDMPSRPNGAPWPKLGGGDDLLATIEHDIKPRVAALCGESPSTTTLFGHSLGGLMVLHAFSSCVGSYNRYFAASPSIWFNDRKVISDVAARLALPFPRAVALQIVVGGAEEYLTSNRAGPHADPVLRAAWVASNRMVGNARDLAQVIRKRNLSEFDFAFDELPGADHRSILPSATRRALQFAGMR